MNLRQAPHSTLLQSPHARSAARSISSCKSRSEVPASRRASASPSAAARSPLPSLPASPRVSFVVTSASALQRAETRARSVSVLQHGGYTPRSSRSRPPRHASCPCAPANQHRRGVIPPPERRGAVVGDRSQVRVPETPSACASRRMRSRNCAWLARLSWRILTTTSQPSARR